MVLGITLSAISVALSRAYVLHSGTTMKRDKGRPWNSREQNKLQHADSGAAISWQGVSFPTINVLTVCESAGIESQ